MIQELEEVTSAAEVIDPTDACRATMMKFGAHIALVDEETEKEFSRIRSSACMRPISSRGCLSISVAAWPRR